MDADKAHFLGVKIGGVLLHTREDGSADVTGGGAIRVSRNCLRQFRTGEEIKEDAISVICELFRKRDKRLRESYSAVNMRSAAYEALGRTLFVSCDFYRALVENPALVDVDSLLSGCALADIQYIVIFVKSSEWTMLIVDMRLHCIYAVYPRINPRIEVLNEHLNSILVGVEANLQVFLARLVPTYEERWRASFLQHMSYEPLQNDHDSGMYCVAICFFFVASSPIFFTKASIANFRATLAYWLLVGEFPA